MKTILLIGGTGNGKSTLANVLTNTDRFKEGDMPTSQTQHADVHEGTPVQGECYRVVDTFGVGDPQVTPEDAAMRVADAISQCKGGLHQVRAPRCCAHADSVRGAPRLRAAGTPVCVCAHV